MKNVIRPVIVLFVLLTVMVGVVYPLVVTGIGHAVFPSQTSGSLIEHNGKLVGSAVIGQQFDAPYYFWGRLSATTPMPYNAQNSGGSNLGPTNPALADEIKGRIDALKAAGTDMSQPVPVDLVTSSASGLDPEISPAAAAYQAARVAKARGLTADQVNALVSRYTSARQWGILGEARVNVLKLNLALDDLKPMHG
ncbi:K+-transporting ATPase subunit C [Paraburkholderia ginsengiterrae]|uniref:Potassium-transporting ATPase KdpC subunit n=1 Tax=Paraburkholderia ginsengiterrae TaxID=1462993 RepID=A0A1A9N2T7_9BURK|nr:potassium-transporting ATPase subunit KdpC [Paraburkholderia ginsengiterrae]OAJ53228.1 K+-transporting ATPase subunit C [Paraburkholderia ginsengiterrae]OAJ56691.1 K+-transporting ATPase subunit C [Paraburkholderia ginsengiterrae]